VEQVDMDGDGSLETSLWPVSDLLGSIELVTDGSGSIVERITYDPEGRPQVWSADTQRPRVTRVAWTGDGSDSHCPAGIPAVACPPGAFQLGFGEELDGESAAGATATLTPQGGQPVPLTLTLTPDGRAAYLTGATLQAGTSYTLQLEGLRDRAGNLLWQWGAHTGAPLLTFTLTDPAAYQVLEDTAPPRLLAAVDAQDGLYLAWEEPVEVASGFTLDTSIAVLRQGQPVAGRVTRLSPQLFRWQPAQAGQWLAGGEYTLSAVHLQDLAGKAASAPSLSFTHMATSSQVAYLVYQAPSDSQPQARSAYGLTTLFQGRSWHEELGLYHYRARWYSPELGDFLERDPLGYVDSPNLYQFVNRDPVNFLDPLGQDWAEYNGVIITWFAGEPFDRGKPFATFPATSGYVGFQSPTFAAVKGLGPIPEGTYKINLTPDPNRLVKVDLKTGNLYWNPAGGIERVPQGEVSSGQIVAVEGIEYERVWRFDAGWGTIRAQLEPVTTSDALKARFPADRFYVHDSHKGFTHGCVETSTEFFIRLLHYREEKPNENVFFFRVKYDGVSTKGNTERKEPWLPNPLLR
jgi:RHS repeat-associated protein